MAKESIRQKISLRSKMAFPFGFRANNESESQRPLENIWLVSFLALSKPKMLFLGLSFLRNQTETFALPRRLQKKS